MGIDGGEEADGGREGSGVEEGCEQETWALDAELKDGGFCLFREPGFVVSGREGRGGETSVDAYEREGSSVEEGEGEPVALASSWRNGRGEGKEGRKTNVKQRNQFRKKRISRRARRWEEGWNLPRGRINTGSRPSVMRFEEMGCFERRKEGGGKKEGGEEAGETIKQLRCFRAGVDASET